MAPSSPPASSLPRATGARWTAEERGAAFKAYFSTGSRARARKQTGVPERTLSLWLKDARYEEERRAVKAGLLAAVEQDAAHRGAELAEATREAILVCRKALRQDPDGKTSSSLLSALNPARETEDRIQRLDDGSATEIHGLRLSDEDRAAFQEWQEERRAREACTDAELLVAVRAEVIDGVRWFNETRDGVALREILAALVADDGGLLVALRDDLALAMRLQHGVSQAVELARRDACGV